MERPGAFNVDHLHREDLLRLMEQVGAGADKCWAGGGKGVLSLHLEHKEN